MNTRAKTIQIFLPGGDPQGIRVAEITTRIVQLIEVPRALLPEFLKMPESAQVALYFLVGEAEDGAERRVYIGQTGDLPARLAKHNKEKAFWERALVLISRTNSLTQTHALFLEWYSLQRAKQAERYDLSENKNGGSKPHTPAPLEADCLEIFETGQTLLATLGYPVFEPVAKPTEAGKPAELFHCKRSGIEGKGLYTPEGFVVLKGSLGHQADAPSIAGTWAEHLRNKLRDSGVVQVKAESIEFLKDHLFASPSAAAVALLGRTANGWVEWKSAEGKTLDALKRQGGTDLSGGH
ncbi:protein of unknown function [Formivibrio citricus]|uniref:GIY-YIG domain-containing protein n=1 Tax=Formivibrio citricus TaxID=83765 RepID=A0A1I5AH19_9NEIS|nr:GIY-YIG nuclease family protein [Formivibrio citricus]SFN61737.1 protein of unknown function [Formivibrio citricus]